MIGPDGPVYPGTCRHAGHTDPGAAIRLNMARAVALTRSLAFLETGPEHPGQHRLVPEALVQQVGDVVLARRDIGTSYHLSVVVDDAAQGITHVVRGADLFAATAVHVVLQQLLALPQPVYHHHRLIRDDAGKRLAKRDDARALAHYRAEGVTPAQLRARLGLAAR
jgi:glutamyl-Q tRNA(Asp) synthetase